MGEAMTACAHCGQERAVVGVHGLAALWQCGACKRWMRTTDGQTVEIPPPPERGCYQVFMVPAEQEERT